MKKRINKKTIAIGGILLIGLLLVVYLVQRQQELRSRAQELYNSVEFSTDDPGKTVERTGQNTIQTNTQNIKIQLNIENPAQ